MSKKLFFSGIVLALALGGFIGYVTHKRSVSGDIEELAYYKATYLANIGFSQVYGNYDLHSFDGGLNWYAVEINRPNNSAKVKGPAEEVFPGLLAEIEGLKRLSDYVTKNGPLTLSGGRAESDLSVLKGAGFIVTAK